jgi:hypothetical protein
MTNRIYSIIVFLLAMIIAPSVYSGVEINPSYNITNSSPTPTGTCVGSLSVLVGDTFTYNGSTVYTICSAYPVTGQQYGDMWTLKTGSGSCVATLGSTSTNGILSCSFTAASCGVGYYLNPQTNTCVANPVCTLPSVLNTNSTPPTCVNSATAAQCAASAGSSTGQFYTNQTTSSPSYCLNNCQASLTSSVCSGVSGASGCAVWAKYSGLVCQTGDVAGTLNTISNCPPGSEFILSANSCQVPVSCIAPLQVDYFFNTCVAAGTQAEPTAPTFCTSLAPFNDPVKGCVPYAVCTAPLVVNMETNSCVLPPPGTNAPTSATCPVGQTAVGTGTGSYCVPSSDNCLNYDTCKQSVDGTGLGTPGTGSGTGGGSGTGSGSPGGGAGSAGTPASSVGSGSTSTPSPCTTTDANSIGCSEYGTPTDNVPLGTSDNSPTTITPVSFGSSGACPAPVVISVMSGHSMTIDYTPICNFASGVRPVILLLAWMAAGFIFIEGVKS